MPADKDRPRLLDALAPNADEFSPAPSSPAQRSTPASLLVRNSLLNFAGQLAPLLVGLVAIPLVIEGLGTERFGVLTLAWMAIGYFGLFDFGISRALTQLLADAFGTGDTRGTPGLTWTALLLMFVLGTAGALALALLAPWLTGRVLNVPGPLQREALASLYLLAFSLPWVITTAGLRGVLEALQRFDLVNAVRVPLGVAMYLSPLLVLPFTNSLAAVVAVLVAARLLTWAAHLALCLRAFPALSGAVAVQAGSVLPLIRFGGWMTVTNVVSPIMVYLDRFLIGAVLSMAAVAYYVTPYEVVIKLLLIPGALLAVLFPAFASSFRADPARAGKLAGAAMRVLLLVLFPVALVAVVIAEPALRLWLGPEFAQNSTRVLQVLVIGVLANSLAQVPFTLVQGAGRPEWTGKLHLAELPLYLLALWWMITAWGIVGAALAWTARVMVDGALLLLLARRLAPSAASSFRRLGILAATGMAALAAGAFASGAPAKVAVLLVGLPVFALAGWSRLLEPPERELIRGRGHALRLLLGFRC